MKIILIKWLLPMLMDLLLSAARDLVSRTDNTIDDAAVEKFAANKDSLVDQIKRNL